MKRSFIWGIILGSAALVATAIGYGARVWTMQCEAEMRLNRAQVLESRHQSLRAEIETGTQKIQGLQEALGGASNRIDEMGRLLDAEKKTNDPIRRQIEDMLVDQISLRTKLSEAQRRLSESERMVRELQKQMFDARMGATNAVGSVRQ